MGRVRVRRGKSFRNQLQSQAILRLRKETLVISSCKMPRLDLRPSSRSMRLLQRLRSLIKCNRLLLIMEHRPGCHRNLFQVSIRMRLCHLCIPQSHPLQHRHLQRLYRSHFPSPFQSFKPRNLHLLLVLFSSTLRLINSSNHSNSNRSYRHTRPANRKR